MFKAAWLFLVLSGIFALPSQALIPLPNSDGEYLRDADGNVTMGNQSFRDLKAVTSDGGFQADSVAVNFLGYDPSRSWSAGDRPEDIFKFGDVKSYGLAEYSLQQLNPSVDAGQMPLSSLRILESQTIEELVEAIPELSRMKIKHIPPLKDNLPKHLHNRTVRNLLETDVNQYRSELEAGARQEIDYLVAQEVERQNAYIEQGVEEGIAAVSENVINRFSIQQPDIKLNLEATANAANISSNRQLNQVAQTLEQNISGLVEDKTLGKAAINQEVEQEYARYSQEVENIVAENIQNYQVNLEQEVSKQLAQAGLPPDIDLSQDFGNIDEVMTDFANDIVADAQSRVEDTVTEELAKAEELARSLPTEMGEIELGDYDLSQYRIEDLPGAESTPIKEYASYEESAISEVPGASDLSFDQYPYMPQFGTGVATVDWVFSNAEKYTDRTISGSVNDTFNLAHCRERQSINGDGCAHIELIGNLIAFNSGKQWVSGDSQEVSGGKNALKGDGKEPTGRLPALKSPMKMVLRNLNETTDLVEMFLALQICFTDPLGTEHCTPHDIVEIPIWTFKRDDLIFLGVII